MTPFCARAACAVIAMALAGCGVDDGEPFGMYQLDSYVRSSSSCAGGVPLEESPSHFRLRESLYDHDGNHELLIDLCDSAEPFTCDSGDGSFVYQTATGYRGASAFAAGDLWVCLLSFDEVTVTVDADEVTWRRQTYQRRGSVSSCTEDEAATQGTSMDCVGFSQIVGRRAE